VPETTEAPTTEAPTTEAPTTEAPTTDAPTTIAPTTAAPTTQSPTTAAPTTAAPTTAAPTVPPTPGGPKTPKPFPVSPKPFTWVSSNFADPFVAVATSKTSITGFIAPDWRDGSQYSDVDVTYSGTGGRGGGVAQRMQVTAVRSGQAQVAHRLDFVAGWRYEATVWVKGTGNVSVNFQQDVAPFDVYSDAAIQLNGDWQQVRLTGLIPRTDPGNLVINATKIADFAFDDIEVRAVQATAAAVTGTPITGDTFGIHEGRLASMALRNAGFEGGGANTGTGALATGAVIRGAVATGWGDNSFWADVDVTYSMDKSTVHGGSASQRIDIGAIRSGDVEIGQYMNVKVPAKLRYSEWMRGPNGTTGRLVLRQTGLPYAIRNKTDVVFNGQWQLVTVEANLTASQTDVFLQAGFDSPGTYWIDDAELLNVDTNKAPDWIPAPSVGGTMRLWDTYTTWSRLEPQKGVWDWTLLDRYVALAESRQQNVLLTLGQSPAWASKNNTELNYFGLGSVYAPKSLDDWRDMVRTISTRYKGRIDGYEIWNEPNDPNFGKLSISELMDLTRTASQEIRAIDPSAKIISASPYSNGYLDQYLAAGAGDYVDVIGYHEYRNDPEGMLSDLSNVRYTLDDYNVNKPLWMTEGGAGNETTDETAASDLMLRWNLVSLASGMQRSFWYTWGAGINISAPTSKEGSYEPNAAFRALADMQKRLTGRTLTKVSADAATGKWLLEFTNDQGNVLRATWTRGGSEPAQPVVWS
jgi:Glycosyl hydrolases family 39